MNTVEVSPIAVLEPGKGRVRRTLGKGRVTQKQLSWGGRLSPVYFSEALACSQEQAEMPWQRKGCSRNHPRCCMIHGRHEL